MRRGGGAKGKRYPVGEKLNLCRFETNRKLGEGLSKQIKEGHPAEKKEKTWKGRSVLIRHWSFVKKSGKESPRNIWCW